MGLLTALVALVATDAHFDARADARLETRARTSTTADVRGPNEAAGDAEVTPSLWGAVEDGAGRLALRYAPTFRVREPYAGFHRTEYNNSQNLEATWSREGRPRFYLLENFYEGRVDLGTQPTTTTPFKIGGITQAVIDVNTGVATPLSRLVTLDTSVGFNFGTGLDAPSLTAYPSQRAWRTRARLEAQVTRVDSIIGLVEGNYAQFPGLQSQFAVGSSAARWKRQLLSSTALELGLRAGLMYSSVTRGTTGAPGGDVILTHRIATGAHLLVLDAGASVSPFVDRYLAAAFNRAELSTMVTYAFRERWVVSLRGAAARSITPVQQLTADMMSINSSQIFTTYVEARAGYLAPRWWQLELVGINSTFLTIGQPNWINNWLVSLSLTLHAEGQF